MSHTKIKALLVEDQKLAQRVAEVTLTQRDCEVDAIDTGGEALERLQKNTYDIIFMDLGLPDIDGLTVTETIRRLGVTTPIIALTAHMNESYKTDCLEAGISEFLMKPLTDEKTEKVLNEFVLKK